MLLTSNSNSAPHGEAFSAARARASRYCRSRSKSTRRSKSTEIWPCEGIARSQRQCGSRCSGRIRCGVSAFETFMCNGWLELIAIDRTKARGSQASGYQAPFEPNWQEGDFRPANTGSERRKTKGRLVARTRQQPLRLAEDRGNNEPAKSPSIRRPRWSAPQQGKIPSPAGPP